jgi:hypothetical protein
MPQKKASPTALRSALVREQLEQLYARRMAVNRLIRSLERYHAVPPAALDPRLALVVAPERPSAAQ